MKTKVIGLGNPMLGDDGIGWRIASALEMRLLAQGEDTSIEIEYLSLGGLSLMERLIGFEGAIIMDAIQTRQGPEGSVYVFALAYYLMQKSGSSHLGSSHDTSLQNAISSKLGDLWAPSFQHNFTLSPLK